MYIIFYFVDLNLTIQVRSKVSNTLEKYLFIIYIYELIIALHFHQCYHRKLHVSILLYYTLHITLYSVIYYTFPRLIIRRDKQVLLSIIRS